APPVPRKHYFFLFCLPSRDCLRRYSVALFAPLSIFSTWEPPVAFLALSAALSTAPSALSGLPVTAFFRRLKTSDAPGMTSSLRHRSWLFHACGERRSEERRVGKECRSQRWRAPGTDKR